MEFLGSSQTFIGVLASLMVTCIILEARNNFIVKIYDEVIGKIGKYLNDYYVDTGHKQLINISSYKLLERYINDLKKQGLVDNEALNKALNMELKYITTIDEIKARNATKVEAIDKKKSNIKIACKRDGQLIVLGPLYALFSCVVIFICDELIRFHSTYDFDVTFLSIFLLISAFFWIVIWCNYMLDVPQNNRLQRLKELFKKVNSPLLWILLGFICIYVGCWVVSLYISLLLWKYMVIIGIGMLFPIFTIATIKLYNHFQSEKATFLFCTNHFVAHIMMSLLYTIIAFVFIKCVDGASEAYIIYENLNMLRICSITFILFIGLIFPLFMPYIKYTFLLYQIKRKVSKIKASVEIESKDVRDKLEMFCESIPSVGH